MDRRTVEWFLILARALLWAAAVVLVLSVIGAIQIAFSESAVPFFEEAERQSRGIAAVGAIGGGIAAAGVLAGLGAILWLLLDARDQGPR